MHACACTSASHGGCSCTRHVTGALAGAVGSPAISVCSSPPSPWKLCLPTPPPKPRAGLISFVSSPAGLYSWPIVQTAQIRACSVLTGSSADRNRLQDERSCTVRLPVLPMRARAPPVHTMTGPHSALVLVCNPQTSLQAVPRLVSSQLFS
jgi:hypothetical protein